VKSSITTGERIERWRCPCSRSRDTIVTDSAVASKASAGHDVAATTRKDKKSVREQEKDVEEGWEGLTTS